MKFERCRSREPVFLASELKRTARHSGQVGVSGRIDEIPGGERSEPGFIVDRESPYGCAFTFDPGYPCVEKDLRTASGHNTVQHFSHEETVERNPRRKMGIDGPPVW
ncbi:hypothetical protein SDC9_142757 [bioreactor metagenome]|uniref:Uncharacterized protein n=1 Tax=bioreactor metagenome TaxID=1076179 RepID=A0A645E4U8_9ZZZZ